MNQLDLRARITGPSGKTVQHVLPQTAPGHNEGTFTPRERATHVVSLFHTIRSATAASLFVGDTVYG